MTILGVDTSNHNHPNGAVIDWAQVAASGHVFGILKATEGVGFRDGWLDRDRAGAHAARLLVGLYHFARAGDPVAQARYFLAAAGALQPGEFVVLDDEDAAITPAWVQAWCDTVFAAVGVKPLVYINQSVQNGQNWSGLVADNDGEWLAKYDGGLAQPSGGAWGAPAMKQYSDAGTVAGIAGGVDLDVFYGTPAQLAAYGLGGAHTSTVQEDDMRLFRNKDDGGVYVFGEFSVSLIGNNAIWADYIAIGYPDINSIPEVDTAAFQTLQNEANARLAALVNDIRRNVLLWTPDDLNADGTAKYAGVPWLFDMVHGIDGKTDAKAIAAAVGQAQVDPAALGAALAASPGFVQALVSQIVAGLDADLSKRFGPTT